MIRTPRGVIVNRREFDALLEYSCSLPTETTIGKQWKRRVPYEIRPGVKNEWWLGEYVETYAPGQVGIEWARLLLPPGLE